MINWNKYIERGDFKSTHGIKLPFKWEFNKLETEERDKEIIITSVLSACLLNDLVVIHTVHPKDLEKYAKVIYYPKIDFMKKQGILGKYVVYDDVVTTGISMLKCTEKIGHPPEFYLCIIDRRNELIKEIANNFFSIISIERDLLKGFSKN